MNRILQSTVWMSLLAIAFSDSTLAQQPPYDAYPEIAAPYFRVRYVASDQPQKLAYAASYTVWIPQEVQTLRGVIVHQHGCGPGSCKSGLTAAFDLHWQALAKKHGCALLGTSYEQPSKEADCQLWCDPRNGSSQTFQQALTDLGHASGHPELARVPWALWGHSGGGHWAGGMVMLHPDRVAAAWLRSGVPSFEANPAQPLIKPHQLPDAALQVPVMCNLGTKEGFTVKDGRFASVWPANVTFFNKLRSKRGLVGIAIDPLTAHECGNQRYLAIPWLDACLEARLPNDSKQPLNPMPTQNAWLATLQTTQAFAADKFAGNPVEASWLPNKQIARLWMEYVKDTNVTDTTAPSPPMNLRLSGNTLSWDVVADLESGIAQFVIERDGKRIATIPQASGTTRSKNPFGRPIFQGLQYSDTPTNPLMQMQFKDLNPDAHQSHRYRIFATNTVGLESNGSEDVTSHPVD
ncbi:MAG: hypothetical protein ABJZ55_11740 [Fuerstiella sp.]